MTSPTPARLPGRAPPLGVAVAFGLLTLMVCGFGVGRIADYYEHGLTFDWYATHEGRRVPLARTVEQRPAMRNEHRPVERYLTHWDERKLGLPSGLPLLDARISGTVWVPAGPPRRLEIDSSGDSDLRIDGQIPSGNLSPGEHEVEVRWRSVMQNPGINWDRTPDVHLLWNWVVEDPETPQPPRAFSDGGPEVSADGGPVSDGSSDAPVDAERDAPNDALSGDALSGDAESKPDDDQLGQPILQPRPVLAIRPGIEEAVADSEEMEDAGDPQVGEESAEADSDEITRRARAAALALRAQANAAGPEREPRTHTEAIPSSAFRPIRTDDAPFWTWLLGGLWSLLLALAVMWMLRSYGETRRFRLFILGCLAITTLAVPLRTFEYNAAPGFRENMDELFVMWNGWQLLEDGTTRGWSLWDGYYGSRVQREPIVYWRLFPTTTITPYFEHPPLFHLMAGAAVHLGGAEHYSHAKHRHARVVPIALSILALWLTMALGYRIGGKGTGLLAGLLQGTLPIITLQSRILKGDALVAVFVPAILLLFLRWKRTGRRRDLMFAACCASLPAFAKLPAFALVIALAAMVASQMDGDGWTGSFWTRTKRLLRELRPAFLVLGVGAVMAGFLLIFAAMIDWEGFWYAQSVQATVRMVSPDVLGQFIYDPAINHNRVGRGFLVFLWLGTLVALHQAPRLHQITLGLPLVVYTVAIALPAGTWHYGWYFLPLYPMLTVGAGLMLRDLYRRPAILGGLMVVGLLTLYAMQLATEPEWALNQGHWNRMRRITWITTLAVLAPIGAAQVFKWKRLRVFAQVAITAALLLYVGASTRFTMLFDETNRTLHDYDFGKPGVPVPGGRRDPLDGAFEHPSGIQEPEFTVPPAPDFDSDLE